MIIDGLWDVYGQKHMGTCGDACALKYEFSRREQDDFAVRSHTRARQAIAEGVFDDEIVPIEITLKGKTTVVSVDEGPAKFDEAKLRALKPAFGSEGTITAGNASSISDGAAALLVASRGSATAGSTHPVAEIVGAATFSQQPEWFTTAPVEAIRKLLDKVGWTVDQVDLFEINEAFAVVAMFAERELRIPSAQDQHPRRGRGARAPDRRERCADPGHALECIEAHRRPAWHRQPLHRRRRSRRTRGRTIVMSAGSRQDA